MAKKKRSKGASRPRTATTTTQRTSSVRARPAVSGDGRKRAAQERRPAPTARRGPGRFLLVLIAGVVVIGGYYLWQWHQARRPAPPPTFASPAPNLAARTLPGLQTGPAPWGTSAPDLRARLEAIGLPVVTDQGVVLHIHNHLDVFVNGRHLTVPANLGINAAGGYLSPLHTHDDSGLIHVESPVDRTYTLGQLFDVWGVRFTKTCLGGYCDKGDSQVRAFVGGKPIRGDPRLLDLALHQEIVVTYGTKAQLPHPVPSRYSFPIGA